LPYEKKVKICSEVKRLLPVTTFCFSTLAPFPATVVDDVKVQRALCSS
jgi:hypothetical protein